MMFVVERRMPNVSTADLALLQKALVYACDRLNPRGEPVFCTRRPLHVTCASSALDQEPAGKDRLTRGGDRRWQCRHQI